MMLFLITNDTVIKDKNFAKTLQNNKNNEKIGILAPTSKIGGRID